MGRIGIFSFFNQYESKRYFARQLEKSLQKLGIKTLLIDPIGGELTLEIDRKMRDFQPDFTLSFNTILPSSRGLFLWDYSEIPHLSILLDPAFYSLNLLNSPFSKIASVDFEDCSWLKEEYGVDSLFWPHASEPFHMREDEKLFDVVFLGTCTDYRAIEAEWKHTLTSQEQELVEEAIQFFWSSPLKSYREVLKKSEDIPNVRYERLFYYLDQYVRGKDRLQLIQNIHDAKVHVFGEPSWNNPSPAASWKKYLHAQKNVVLHEAVSFEESFDIMRKAKICLNSSPFFKHGSHERFLNALALGALPLTTYNRFIEQFFEDGRDLLTYQVGQWNQVNDIVNQALVNERVRLDQIERGRHKVLQFHTWDKRAEELCNYLFK